jgi:hypothetical protein
MQKANTQEVLGQTLRQFKCKVIFVGCVPCGRLDELNRAEVVKRYGATMPLARLRRRLSLGCEHMNGVDGMDRCGTTITAEPPVPAPTTKLGKGSCNEGTVPSR